LDYRDTRAVLSWWLKIQPTKWVIVDDGSTDTTPQILAEYQAKHDWIEVITRSNRGRRAVGSGVIDAFYAGYEIKWPRIVREARWRIGRGREGKRGRPRRLNES
jgi:hypothetical protein